MKSGLALHIRIFAKYELACALKSKSNLMSFHQLRESFNPFLINFPFNFRAQLFKA